MTRYSLTSIRTTEKGALEVWVLIGISTHARGGATYKCVHRIPKRLIDRAAELTK